MLIANTLAVPADQIFAHAAPTELTHGARLARRRLLHAADLLRLLRLLRHGDRPRPRCSASASPRTSTTRTSSRSIHGLLAALAHVAVDLVPRLRLHPARRQPGVAGREPTSTCVIVFFLCGLWHGASWTFVVWGLYHGVFLVLERVGLAARISALASPLRHAYALLVVMVGWVFFRADTLTGAAAMLAAMVGAGGTVPATYAPAWYLEHGSAAGVPRRRGWCDARGAGSGAHLARRAGTAGIGGTGVAGSSAAVLHCSRCSRRR